MSPEKSTEGEMLRKCNVKNDVVSSFSIQEVLSIAFMEMQGVLKLAFHFCHLKEIVQEDFFLSVFSLCWVWGFFPSLCCSIFSLVKICLKQEA